METVELGKTGRQVSALCLGTMYFGSSIDEATSIGLLDRYAEAGGSFFDTSNTYARWISGCQGGESETVLGNWMSQRSNRSQLFLATKVGFPMPVDDQGFGLSAEQIEGACDKSLKRLGTDYIDLYYAHVDERQHSMSERLEAFDRLVKKGKVRFIGASNAMAWRLEEASWISKNENWSEFCCIQQRYSYVRPQSGAVYDPHVVINDEQLDYCKNRGITILAYSPLLSGAYVRKDRQFPPEYYGSDLDTRLSMLRDVAGEIGVSVNQVVLAWLLRSEPVVIPIIAASKTEHLDENMKSLEVKIKPEQLQRLSQAGNIRQQNPLGQRKIVMGMKEG